MSTSFSALLSDFRDYLNSKNLSPRTVEEYPRYVSYFLAHLESKHIHSIEEVTLQHLREYHMHLMEREWKGKPLSVTTQRIRLSQVKTFFTFLYHTGKITHDPSAHLPLPKRPKKLPKGILDVKEMDLLLSSPDCNTPLGMRDRAMLELFYSNGLRSSELTSLEVQDIHLEASTVRVMGKGQKEAIVPFGRQAQKALEQYLIQARPKLLEGNSGGKKKSPKALAEEKGKDILFLTKNGHKLNVPNTWAIVKKHVRAMYEKQETNLAEEDIHTIKAGSSKLLGALPRNTGPHGLRHSCATHLLKNGMDLRLIQKLLRHKDLNTTQIYTRVTDDDLQEAQLRHHPRERIA
jgi:integrase/recombinase XerD